MMGKKTCKVYWAAVSHPLFENRPLYAASTDEGICRITWPHESFESLRNWADKTIPGAVMIEDEAAVRDCKDQLLAYLDGNRRSFDLQLDLRGTEFQLSVWQALKRIPYGEIRSYSEIAEAVGRPSAVRAVGTANGANPVPIIVPCHRVIGKNAALTGFRGGLRVKESLLHLEGFQDYEPVGHERFRF